MARVDDMTGTGNGAAEERRAGSRVRSAVAHWWHTPGARRRGAVLAACALLLALVMVLHRHIPNDIGNLGSLIETFLPWFGLLVPLLAGLALLRRAPAALVAVLVPAVVWLNLFGGLVTDKNGPGGDLMVVSHNVNADNPDPGGTARAVAASGADVLALVELKPAMVPVYEEALAGAYRYHSVRGTVGLWSRYPLDDSRPVDIRLGWTRAMRATVSAPGDPSRCTSPTCRPSGSSCTPGSPPTSATAAPTGWARPSPPNPTAGWSSSATSTAP